MGPIAGWLVVLGIAGAATAASTTARAQANSAPAPASVPVRLGTRDPTDRSVQFPVITKPARTSGASTATAGKPAAVSASTPTAASGSATTGKASGPVASSAGPAPSTPTSTSTAASASTPASASPQAATPEPRSIVKVKGLHGTLNRDDVHQTMDARQAEIDRCIEAGRRGLRWLNGSIRFSFRVDAEGRVAEVHPTASSVGQRELEQCVRGVLEATQFPRPAGRAAAAFNWGMSFEAANGKSFEPADPKLIARALKKHARELFRDCEVRRGKNRFQVTAYISAGGQWLAAGAVPIPARADDKLDCVLEQLAKWKLPKQKRAAKLSFELR